MFRICHLFISPNHNFFGHHNQPAGEHPIIEVDHIECVSGKGIRGDRFYDFKENYKGQITLFSFEVFQALQRELNLPHALPSAMRRNVIVRNADLSSLIGTTFDLQNVRLAGIEECRPCHWMDQALGPGAHQWLIGRGGLRARILSNGTLHRDP